MANQLKMAISDTILALHQRQWSIRRIAATLGIHRDTVARHLRRAKLGQAPTGSTGVPAAEVPTEPHAPVSARVHHQPSQCEPFRAVIRAQMEQGLSAQRIYQDLVAEHGFTAKYPSVRRFVRQLGRSTALPFRRLECAPGVEAQVDFGTGAPILQPDRTRRRTYVFRIVLSHSRKGYSEAVYRQTTDDFLRCLENAFAHFGGVPQTLVLDNLKAGVLQPDWFDPELNPKLRAFADHYGLALLPTRPATPRHKGKIENGVGYVKDNALKGRVFASLEEQNRHLLTWETTVADTRIHGTTRQQVGKLFGEAERPALQSLPQDRFPCFHEGQRVVHRDGHIEIGRAYYSVPPEYLGRRLWVRWDGRLVRIFTERMEPIAVHAQHEPGRFSTQAPHIAAAKISAVERGAAWLLGQVRRLGPHSTRWAEAVLAVRGVEGVRVVHGLLSLPKRHAAEAIEQACAIASSYGSYRLRTVRTLIARHGPTQEHCALLPAHPLIRPLAEYTQFVQTTFPKEGPS
jgi:transposase